MADQQPKAKKDHFCPGCGQPVSKNQRFCGSCGRALKPVAKAADNEPKPVGEQTASAAEAPSNETPKVTDAALGTVDDGSEAAQEETSNPEETSDLAEAVPSSDLEHSEITADASPGGADAVSSDNPKGSEAASDVSDNSAENIPSNNAESPEPAAEASSEPAQPSPIEEPERSNPSKKAVPTPSSTVTEPVSNDDAENSRPAARPRGLAIGIVVAVVAAVAILGFTGWWFFAKADTGPATVDVPITIYAENYSDECTKIPLQVEGETAEGGAVSMEAFASASGSNLSLGPGTYTVSFPASPLTPNGILYVPPSKSLSLTITMGEDGTPSITGDQLEATFTLSTALDETDEMIETAYEWAIKDPEQAQKAEELRDMAEALHTAAIAQKEDADAKETEQGETDQQQATQQEPEQQANEQEAEQKEVEQQAQNGYDLVQGWWTTSYYKGFENYYFTGDEVYYYTMRGVDGQVQGPNGPFPVTVEPDSDGGYTVAINRGYDTLNYTMPADDHNLLIYPYQEDRYADAFNLTRIDGRNEHFAPLPMPGEGSSETYPPAEQVLEEEETEDTVEHPSASETYVPPTPEEFAEANGGPIS